MSERKPRATKAESLKAKIEKNAAAMAKYQEKLNELAAIDADLKQQLKDLNDEKKKAERALEAKAKREQKKKEEEKTPEKPAIQDIMPSREAARQTVPAYNSSNIVDDSDDDDDDDDIIPSFLRKRGSF